MEIPFDRGETGARELNQRGLETVPLNIHDHHQPDLYLKKKTQTYESATDFVCKCGPIVDKGLIGDQHRKTRFYLSYVSYAICADLTCLKICF